MTRPTQILAASMLVTFVLGSVHAFSVFLVPLEEQLDLPRSQISLIYSFALVAITLSVTLGYRIYARMPAWCLIMITAALAAFGLLLASAAVDWWILFIGYSLAFGISNGIGYGFCLQLVGQAMPANKGFAMGAVTATYAVGSIVFAKIFSWRIEVDSVSAAFVAIAITLSLFMLVAALMMRQAKASYAAALPVPNDPGERLDRRNVLQFWFAYLTSVFAGLMAIGHAAAIAQTRGASVELATSAAMTVGVGSALGGFIAGWLVDRWPLTRFLVALPLLSALALLCISATESAALTVFLLGFVGLAYGSIIAIYPVAISNHFREQGARAYGQVFIAWGFAGLVAPWCAGFIYDWQGGYEVAMLIAAVVALISTISVWMFRLARVV